jgi:hypothetical protein
VQAATVNKSLQLRRRLRDFFALVWGLPLVAVYVPVLDNIRSEGFAVAANISRRSGGALILQSKFYYFHLIYVHFYLPDQGFISISSFLEVATIYLK